MPFYQVKPVHLCKLKSKCEVKEMSQLLLVITYRFFFNDAIVVAAEVC